jgi:hypothetical protein
MKINSKLREVIEEDIIDCKSYQTIEGSKGYFDQLVAKYSQVDIDFSKNLIEYGKATVPGRESDYRPQLKNVAAKLEMWLLTSEDNQENQQLQNQESSCESKQLVFISHRSIDKAIADMLFDFLIGTGVPRDRIFCSSLPGNDVKEKISVEVKAAIKSSALNIVILTNDYYQSAYCLNEAGIMWFCDNIPVIPVALPEITPENMFGFMNSEYKIRRLDCEDDISYMYDIIRETTSAEQCKASILTPSIAKLKLRYEEHVAKRSVYKPSSESVELEALSSDEAIVLYYILSKQVRIVKKSDINLWFQDEELYGINVENAFDLLSTLGNSKHDDFSLELDIDIFRKYLSKCNVLLPSIGIHVDEKRRLSRETFSAIWEVGLFDDVIKLFVSYIIDERVSSFGSRWIADQQIKDIKKWQSKCNLDSTLSDNYGSCLGVFIENDLVYVSSCTSYGNPREYTLCLSLRTYLLGQGFQYIDEIIKAKQDHTLELPF